MKRTMLLVLIMCAIRAGIIIEDHRDTPTRWTKLLLREMRLLC
ncbi:MAG TPA: hypothetical protein VE218_14340 [Acidobacteriaceae bacterium]|nr:hypothetical protein [Acidobacteriaceae bacterium]